ncbi:MULTISPECIES: vWA domain-containing protein [Reichenbachiella]|uniref:Ca-activated chloride channel family protein n=1 Tax=Reichenbachiella agariperforans TaxID=156994 RepID=A0A1M6QBV8_REIAG|nr:MULTISPECIES: VWA domain-containing protein [Reichenbachiella]MBU2914305.1 VWA domain-containing protein [Reichenbachiella agariperforans]RJE73027.1 aerotolerance regulator BatB [Reichenbachiella sp. MSK19-1]SHK17610.1 Ca-activated chloride channel family protein [Reichenbachiella agariperforans]
MVWNGTLGTLEIVFILLFGLLYIAYIVRAVNAARALQSSYRRVFYKVVLRTLYFSLFIVALMGPSFGHSQKEIKSVGKDIFICVDLSQSMNAFDIQPSRLEKIKFELNEIVQAFSSDRIGLIMFSNEAYVQCPLTYDKSALGLFIETLNTSLVPNTGTDFGPPLGMALEKITDEENTVSRQKSKIIILISDGEDFGENTESIAKKVEDEGIKLFTLGIGTSRGSKIMTRNGFKKDNQGQEVISKLNATSLKKLAKSTNGIYFEINDKQNDVKKLINTIGDIEGELRDAKQVDVSANKYFYFLALAIVLLLFDVLVRTKTMTI